MIDDIVGAELAAPGSGLGARRGRDYRQPGETSRQLDENGPAPAGAPDDQELAGVGPLPREHAQPVEEKLPGGDRGQRQGGSFRDTECLGLTTDDALIDEVIF